MQTLAETRRFFGIALATDGTGKDAGAKAIDKAGGVSDGLHGGIGKGTAEGGIAGLATGLHKAAATVEADLAIADDQVSDDGGAGIAGDGGVAGTWLNEEVDMDELPPGAFEVGLREQVAGGEVGHVDVGGVLTCFEVGGGGEIGLQSGGSLDAFKASGASGAEGAAEDRATTEAEKGGQEEDGKQRAARRHGVRLDHFG